MKIKGNFTLLYAIEILTGLSLWFAAQKWDLRGLVIVLFLYLMLIILLQRSRSLFSGRPLHMKVDKKYM